MIVVPRPGVSGLFFLWKRGSETGCIAVWFFLGWDIVVIEMWLTHELEDGLYVVRTLEWKDYFASAYD